MFDFQNPTVQMLGRFQPWHKGHTELFKKAHAKTGQVVIMIRETGEKHHNRNAMAQALAAEGFEVGRDYVVYDVPNIVNITYGRDVGYVIEQETLPADVEAISATKIRESA